jgi:RHS repeat-associated protein
MIMPMRAYTAASASKYKYSFNGKEDDTEAEPGWQDYGNREYDRLSNRFISVDPITSKYPYLTPYQFASNRPIDGIDLDGLEYIKAIPNFNYNNDAYDIPKAVDNAFIGIANGFVSFWNSGVDTYKSLKRGTYIRDVTAGAKQFSSNVKQTVENSVNYSLNTPVQKQVSDVFTNPKNIELSVNAYLGLKTFGNNANSFASRINDLKLSADLPDGTQVAGASFKKFPLSSKPLAPKLIVSGCEDIAAKVQKAIGGDFLQITPTEGKFLGPVNYSEGSINGWSYHVAVIKDGKVFDAMTGSSGMDLSKYKAMFEYSDALKFEQTKSITIK